MKLLIISPSQFPGSSGDSTNYIEIISGFVKSGINVILVCPKIGERSVATTIEDLPNNVIYRIPAQPILLKEILKGMNYWLGVWKEIKFYLAEILTVLKLAYKEDIYYCILRHSIHTLPIAFLLKLIGIKCILDTRELPLSMTEYLPRELKWFVAIVEKLIFTLCSKIIIVDPTGIPFLNKLGISNEKFIILGPSFFDTTKGPPYVDLHHIEPYTFGYFGTLEKWQGIEMLIHAFAKVVKKYPLAKLYIIGDGSMYSSLISLTMKLDLAKNVLFTGNVSRQALWQKYFPRFRVVVIPRTASSSLVPMKLLESLAAGKVIITTPINTIKNLFNFAIIVKPQEDEIALAMIYTIENDSKLTGISEAARDFIKRFDVRENISKILTYVNTNSFQ